LTGERAGYYADFGRVDDLSTALERNFVYSGQYSVYRRRRHGNSARDIPAGRFVVFAQNHDQVGNRMLGERLGALASFEDQKLAAGLILLSPFLPLLFMGEEYGETAPFLYFVSHNDGDLIEAVRRGRREEFAAFGWPGAPPDPQAESTFARSKIDWRLRTAPRHSTLWQFHRELIRARRRLRALAGENTESLGVVSREEEKTLAIVRGRGANQTLAVFHFGDRAAYVALPALDGTWQKELDSAEERWLGGGSPAPARFEGETQLTLAPKSFCLYAKDDAVES
jgi:maltooligosyltrehalose trehalohydrolase